MSDKAVTIKAPDDKIFVPLADLRSGIVSLEGGGTAMRVDLTGKKKPVQATTEDFQQVVALPLIALAQDATGGFLLAGLADGELRWLSIENGRVAMKLGSDWGPTAPGDLLCNARSNDLFILVCR